MKRPTPEQRRAGLHDRLEARLSARADAVAAAYRQQQADSELSQQAARDRLRETTGSERVERLA